VNRSIRKVVRGSRAVDGAGVRLVRVLGHADTGDFDPFLMLDSFDSTDPADYIAGFPTHPHRGIETITYLISGRIDHEDSIGNQGEIGPGQGQWMTAGSGILHQEMPKPAERMLGFQLWLNLPRDEKMAPPAYLDITQDMIPEVAVGKATVRVISGQFGGASGVKPRHIQAQICDVDVPAGESVKLDTPKGDTAFIFTILGDVTTDGRHIPEKTAVLFDEGDSIVVQAAEGGARFIYYCAPPLGEPIAWGGPIVMNTREELNEAFRQLKDGTFLARGV
jgi:redox-sensitive bicupin YhaK (pirin superfamily)